MDELELVIEERGEFELTAETPSAQLPKAKGLSEFAETDYAVFGSDLSSVQTAIMEKAGIAESPVWPEGFVEAVGEIPSAAAFPRGTVTEYVDDTLERVASPCFYNQTALTRVSLPNCTTVCALAFYGCTSLSDVYLPKLASCENNLFRNNRSLVSISLPGLTWRLDSSAFEGCTALEFADVGNVGSQAANAGLSSYSFGNCATLKVLVLRNQTRVVPMQSIYALTGTPFAVGGTGGTVYVPEALIEQYKTATNWVTLYEAGTCDFVALEGSKYE